MHKITNVTDRQGVAKQEFIDDMKSAHGDELLGDFIHYDYMMDWILVGVNPVCQFVWNDDSNKMMVTSKVESITEYNDTIKIITRNSVYEFEKVVEEKL